MRDLSIVFWTDQFDSKSSAETYGVTDWASLKSDFATSIYSHDKALTPAWSPVTLKVEPDGEHSVRKKANVKSVSMLVIDIDSGEAPLEMVKALNLHCAHIVYSTWSHKLKGERYRLVIPLDTDIPGEMWRNWYMSALDHIGLGTEYIDDSVTDPCRLHFLPSHGPHNVDQTYFEAHDGPFFATQEVMYVPRNRDPRVLPASSAGEVDTSTPWGDFDARCTEAEWLELLEATGGSYLRDTQDGIQFTRPGKSSGVSAELRWSEYAYGGITYPDGFKRLIVNTPNWPPFEANRSYSASAVRALVMCDGDHKRNAKELRALGYGQNIRPMSAPVSTTTINTDIACLQQFELALEALGIANEEKPSLYTQENDFVFYNDESGTVKPLNRGGLTIRLHQAANWTRTLASGVAKTAQIPAQTLDMLLAAPGSHCVDRARIPELNAICRIPRMMASGFVAENGYDHTTKTLVSIADDVAAACERALEEPSKEKALAAVAELREAFVDIPFADESDWHRTLCALITPFVIHQLVQGGESVPWFVISAPQKGSGKTTLAQAIGALTKSFDLMTYNSNDEELRKVVHSSYRSGVAAIVLDNLNGRVKSDVLASLLTAPKTTFRTLGKSESTTYFNDKIIIGTANNPSIDDDLTKRAVLISLDPRTSSPESRKVVHQTRISERIEREYSKYVGWIFDILSWACLSSETAASIRGKAKYQTRYHAWERAVRNIMFAVDIAPILDSAKELDSTDAVTSGWQNFIQKWWQTSENSWIKLSELTGFSFAEGNLGEALPISDLLRIANDDNGKGQLLGRMVSKRVGQRWRLESIGDVRIEKRHVRGLTQYRLAQG